MKSNLYLLLAVIIISVNNLTAQTNCEIDTTGLVSLVDMQDTVTYMGYEGGLYSGGSNQIPSKHKSQGKSIAKDVLPLDADGNVDFINGKIVFAGMGASTAGNTWNHFTDKAAEDPTLNPCLKLVNACLGAKGIDIMIDTADNKWYWTENIIPKIEGQGVTKAQVQAIWIRTASKEDTIMEFPLYPNGLVDKFAALMPILLDTFPNLKFAYVSGFFYGGYADSAKEFYDIVVEPGSYWTNYAIKWLIERQISRTDTSLYYKGSSRNAPWIGWGPHTWADGNRPNAYDGLYWNCEEDYAEDGGGYHLTNGGKSKDADLLMAWAKTSPTTARWFNDHPSWSACDGAGRLSSGESLTREETNRINTTTLFPNPNTGVFSLQINGDFDTQITIEVFNAIGQAVWRTEEGVLSQGGIVNVDISSVDPGLYFACVSGNGKQEVIRFTVH